MAEYRDQEIKRDQEGIWGKSFLLCLLEEDVKHILLICSEMNNWEEEVVCSKWLNINQDTAHKKITNCTNVINL
jgi:hypothetical protein